MSLHRWGWILALTFALTWAGCADESTGDDDDTVADDDDATPGDDDDATPGDDDDATPGDDDDSSTGDDDDTGPTDADGDGWDDTVDCNDLDPELNLDDVDQDGYSTCDGDCADDDAAIHPGATEICNDLDDDCDGNVSDEEVDNDGDGYSECDGDCDDVNAVANPGEVEVCDGYDNDCNGTVDDLGDADGDGYSICDDCDDADPAVNPAAAEVCDNGIDDDCDGAVDAAQDGDGDGFDVCADCDDTDAATYPGAFEDCFDGVDNDCDGLVDDGSDDDGDGVTTCDGDCDDADASISPDVVEDGCAIPADGLDNDCDGQTDEGCFPLVISPPAYVFDDLYFTLLTGSAVFDALINSMVPTYMPPSDDQLIIIFDPTTGPQAPVFSARGGGGQSQFGTYIWDPSIAVPIEFSVNLSGTVFDTTGASLTLSFALPGIGTLTAYSGYLEGEFTGGMTTISSGILYGEIREVDAAAIQNPLDPSQSMADLIGTYRSLDSDVDGDGTLDAWSFEAEFTAFQF